MLRFIYKNWMFRLYNSSFATNDSCQIVEWVSSLRVGSLGEREAARIPIITFTRMRPILGRRALIGR
jgi:hypothetical protein